MYKTPLYIDGLNGIETTTTVYAGPTTGDSVGAFKFRFEDYDPFIVQSAYFEVIAKNSAGNNTRITLTNTHDNSQITLSGVNPYLQTTSSSLIFLQSDDILSSLDVASLDVVYEIKISVDVASTGSVYMARLVLFFE